MELTSSQYYQEAPKDWLVVITDVVGSTQAIEAGLYKQVNMAGASTIVAITNAIGSREFPFVFGGDGATAMIPPTARISVENYLRSARESALINLGLELRIGIIEHQELIKEGFSVKIARYQIKNGPAIAFFSGEGLTVAEKKVKSGIGIIPDGSIEEYGKALQGLSCRWAPIPSTRGKILSIIIKTRSQGVEGQKILEKVIKFIDETVDLESSETRPVKLKTFKAENPLLAGKLETGIIRVFFEMLITRILDFTGWKLPGINFRRYKASMIEHSDYRKFDESLRLVIDCTLEMSLKIKNGLELENDHIFYGIHESDSALMTCFMQTMETSGHIHFIDGNHGGYALAAKSMKAQMKEI